MYELSVVLLHYRTPELVADCLATLERELAGHPEWTVVVVDNASDDGSAEVVARVLEEKGWGAWARLVRAPRNGGFAAGNNLGVAAVPARFHLLLNSDTLVRPGALAALLEAARAEPRAALVAPRLEWPDARPQQSCFRYATPWSELMRAASTGPLSRLLARHEVALPVPEGPCEAPWVSFAAVLLRAEAIARTGLLDEGFFMYFEDMDLCRRAWDAGFSVRYAPQARIVHLRGGSSSVKRRRAARERIPAYYYASRSRYFAKYYGGVAGVLLANGAWLLGRALSWLRESLGSKAPHVADLEARDIWIGWRDPLGPTAVDGA